MTTNVPVPDNMYKHRAFVTDGAVITRWLLQTSWWKKRIKTYFKSHSCPGVVHQEVLCWEVIILEDTEVDERVIFKSP
jgi:hypothetical protein